MVRQVARRLESRSAGGRRAITGTGFAAARSPYLTAVVSALAVLAAAVQYGVPDAVPLLDRDPGGLADGQVWRLVTPLLVQTLGWHQVVANFVTLVAVGAAAERMLGGWRWGVLAAAGTVGGQVAAYAWSEPGGGDSIAICGLAGGVAVALLAVRGPVPRNSARVVEYYVAALAGWSVGGAVMAAVGCVSVFVLETLLSRLTRLDVERLGCTAVLACAMGMAAFGDLHGVSLVSGAVTMTVLALIVRLRPRDRITS